MRRDRPHRPKSQNLPNVVALGPATPSQRQLTSPHACSLAGNWQEERSRIECGERVHLPLMDAAVVRQFEPSISIAPPTREPGKASSGVLVMPERKRNSRTTNDSSRQVHAMRVARPPPAHRC